jgi:phosphopantetheinyl transferase (holo-ACP synthase)
LTGEARRHAEGRGVRHTMVSLSHDGEYAVAVVVATD